jgi:Na+-translocating ferredoxin:NAD+ oxidoreductase RnfA subunit
VHLVLDLLQGLGIAAAIGIRPFLPVLLAGVLAAGNTGLDFSGTSFAFLERWWFWIVVLVVVLAADLALHRRTADAPVLGRLEWALLAIAVVLGALEAAGSLADRDEPWAIGLVAGALAAALGFLATRSLFARVRRRLDRDAAVALPYYGEGVSLLAAGLSVLFPPLALLVIAGLGWLAAGGRRREGEKYAGLRILR